MCSSLDTAAHGDPKVTMSKHMQAPDFLAKDDLTQAAYFHAKHHLHSDILAHSLRVCMYAIAFSKHEGTKWHSGRNIALLSTACLFHDIGTADSYDTGPVRFEIEGADAATKFLTKHGVSPEDALEVWVAITLHDTPQIAERISDLARLVRLAVLTDFGKKDASGTISKEDTQAAEQEFPRGSIEKVLSDAVVAQAMKQSGKAPRHCWPGDLYRAKMEEPGWEGVNKAF